MAITESQKKYEKKRAKQCRMFAAKYTPSEIADSTRLQTHLIHTGQSANSYLKALIKADLDAKGIPYPVDNTTSDNMPD